MILSLRKCPDTYRLLSDLNCVFILLFAWQPLLSKHFCFRNILRDDSGHLKVADFGVSKLLKVAKTVKEERPLTCLDTACECGNILLCFFNFIQTIVNFPLGYWLWIFVILYLARLWSSLWTWKIWFRQSLVNIHRHMRSSICLSNKACYKTEYKHIMDCWV